jgi:murein DD-endopeptidase MepM/ murein hydrolase activator NlpD
VLLRRWRELPPRVRAALAVGGGALVIVALIVPLTGGESAEALPAAAASLAGAVSASGGTADAGDPPDAAEDAAPAARPPVWRVSELAGDPGTTIVEVVIGRRPLLAALAAAGFARAEAQRLTRSIADVHDADRFGPKDALTIARDKASGRVLAYELVLSPTDVWQAREARDAPADGAPRLQARKLELELERVRVRKAVLVGPDLRASFTDAGLGPIDDVLSMLDDALDGHAELSDIRPGARLRVVATQERVGAELVRWASLDAVEYFPAAANAPPVRVYWFGGGQDAGEASRSKHRGWYDVRGRQPFHGGFRTPLPLARIASRFNPHRMHPVLHVVMPHNGVDFAAPVGAPVYATAAGVVSSVGNDGPCGNKVEIAHPGGITSIYCHLSRFAAGLRVGQHVEVRQLIAYVGQTGRVTGPHLHFGIRRGGVFVDPMTLKLDGVRVVPRAQRDEFDRRRAELDAELDGVALPAPGAPPETGADRAESETFYEEP